MADNQLTPEQAKELSQQLALIDKYYRAIGLSTATIAKNNEIFKNDSKALAETARIADDYFDRMSFSTRDLASTFNSVLSDFKKTNQEANKGITAFKQLNNIAEDIARHQEDVNRLDAKELDNLQKKYVKNKSILENSVKELRERIKQGEAVGDVGEALLSEYQLSVERLDIETELGKRIDEALGKEKNITKELNVRGAILKGSIGLMDNLGLSAFTQVLNLEKANEELEEEYRKTGDLDAAFKKATKSLFDGLKKALQDPATRVAVYGSIAKKAFNSLGDDIKNLYHSFLEVNKEVAEVGRSVGTSSENAHHMIEEVKGVGLAMGDVVFTSKDYAKTIMAVNDSLGLQVNLGGEVYHELTKMTDQMGLSADEASQIYKFGLLNNQTVGEANKSIAQGIVSAQRQFKVQVDAKAVFKEIGKLSASITSNFKQNPEALAKAVVQAKALGTDLDKMDSAAQSLLNFEESIQNELEAELLTGKAINLEKAREAALNNDQVGFMNEIASQLGDIHQFNKMNRLQQEATAKAFGMSRADLADMLQQQEVYTKLGDVSGKSAEEQLRIARERGLSESDSLVVSLQQQASAEKIEKAFENIKMRVAEIVEGPLGQMVGKIAEMLNSTTGISVIIGTLLVGGVAKLVIGFGSLLQSITAIREILFGTKVAQDAIALSTAATATSQGTIAAESVVASTAMSEGAVAMGAQATEAGVTALAQGTIAAESVTSAAAMSEGAIAQGVIAAESGVAASAQALGAASATREAAASGVGAIAKGWAASMSGPAALATGGLAGLVIGGIITAAIMSAMSKSKKVDDFAQTGAGYGDRTLITPKGAYALNNNDTVIAGTNLFRGNDVYSGPTDSINLTGGTDSKLETLSKSITALASRPVTVNANTDTIMKLSTAQSQYGAPSSFA
jgi:hypothetical protein